MWLTSPLHSTSDVAKLQYMNTRDECYIHRTSGSHIRFGQKLFDARGRSMTTPTSKMEFFVIGWKPLTIITSSILYVAVVLLSLLHPLQKRFHRERWWKDSGVNEKLQGINFSSFRLNIYLFVLITACLSNIKY